MTSIEKYGLIKCGTCGRAWLAMDKEGPHPDDTVCARYRPKAISVEDAAEVARGDAAVKANLDGSTAPVPKPKPPETTGEPVPPLSFYGPLPSPQPVAIAVSSNNIPFATIRRFLSGKPLREPVRPRLIERNGTADAK